MPRRPRTLGRINRRIDASAPSRNFRVTGRRARVNREETFYSPWDNFLQAGRSASKNRDLDAARDKSSASSSVTTRRASGRVEPDLGAEGTNEWWAVARNGGSAARGQRVKSMSRSTERKQMEAALSQPGQPSSTHPEKSSSRPCRPQRLHLYPTSPVYSSGMSATA